MDNKVMGVDPISARVLEQNERIYSAYQSFLRQNGDIKSLVEHSKPDYNSMRQTYTDSDEDDYSKLYNQMAQGVGIQLANINTAAKMIRAEQRVLEDKYVDCWRWCAQASMDHPDRPAKEKFCKDYRAATASSDWKYKYAVGDEVTSNLFEGYYFGKVAATQGKEMTVTLSPHDKRRKAKEVIVKMDTLRVFPVTLNKTEREELSE